MTSSKFDADGVSTTNCDKNRFKTSFTKIYTI